MNSLRVSSAELLADISETEFQTFKFEAPQIPSLVLPIRINNHWWKKYRVSRYRWKDLVKAGLEDTYPWAPVRLTRGYFTIVLLRDLLSVTHYPDGREMRWHSHITYDKETGDINGIYAARRGRGDEPKSVFMHRQLLGLLTIGLGDVDHANGESLDNRGFIKRKKPVNLYYCPKRMQNNHNGVRYRLGGLPTGVELKKNGRYGGIRCVRLKRKGKGSVKVIRSRLTWETPEPARRWYLNQLKQLHKRNAWAHDPPSVNFANFGPNRYQAVRARQQEQVDALLATF